MYLIREGTAGRQSQIKGKHKGLLCMTIKRKDVEVGLQSYIKVVNIPPGDKIRLRVMFSI